MDSLPAVRSLDRLDKLERHLLWVFACGPNIGEAILVALPGRGWLVLDGAGSPLDFPAHDLLVKYGAPDDPIDALILTHPHEDHFHGFIDLLAHTDLKLRVKKIGVISEYFSVLPDPKDPDDSKTLDAEASAVEVLRKIEDSWKLEPALELPLIAPGTIATSTGRAQVELLHPQLHHVNAFFTAGKGLKTRLKAKANDLSVVLRVRFGACVVLLSADLAEQRHWSRLVAANLQLNAHSGWKVPHHGSFRALHNGVMGRIQNSVERTWVITPFNSSKLPQQEGLLELLKHEKEIHLCSRPVRSGERFPLDERTTVGGLIAPPVTHHRLPSVLRNPQRLGKPAGIWNSDCIWAFAFNDQGQLESRHRGPAATVVVS